MRKTIISGGLLVALSIGKFASGQENESELDPVTITASLSPEKASRTGRNLVIIKGDRFNGLPVHSIDEMLRYLPGLEVQSRGPLGAQSDIVVRGGTFQQVLVILDGVRLNDPNSGHFTGYIPIAPSEIDRVEILKGASSAIYGTEAVGGVIHIITKSFAAKKGIVKSEANAQITGGQYDLFTLNAGGTYNNGKTIVSGGILSNNTTGQQQRGIKGFVNNNTASVSAGHFFSDRWQLTLRSSYDDRKFAAQNFYTTFVSDTANEKVKTFWNQLRLAYSGKKDKLTLDAGYKDLEDRYAFSSVSVPNQNKSNLFQALVTDEWNVHPKTTIVSGVQFINKRINSNDRGNHRVDQGAAFAVINQQLGDNFFISPAVRLQWNERSGWELVPQANFSYHADRFQLRASAGKTVRDADFTERFNNYNKTLVKSGSIGNPDLEPERSFSYEAGADYFASTNFKLAGTFFQRYHTNLIDYVTTPYSEIPRKDNLIPTGTYALAKNISKVTTTGVEADIQYSVILSKNQRLWSTLGATWLESKSSEATPSFYISSHAKYLVNFNISYSNKWLSLTVNGIYKERNPQKAPAAIAIVSKDYFVLNSKAEFFILQNKLSAFIESDNIFNTTYTDILGSQMPGQWLMGGLKISLSK